MIKVLKLSNKSVTRFNTNKKWNYSTLNAGSNIILEQGDNIPLFSSSVNKLSTEQNDSEFDLNMRFGKKVQGTFFSKDSKYFDESNEPLNYDGSYQRVVYNSIKHLFYNEYGAVGNEELDQYYKNPINIFGSETGIYSSLNFNSKTLENDKRSERRILKDEVTVLEIPSNVFGEKVKPGTLKITDHSSEFDFIEIVDDGNTNLVVGSDTFNSVSEMNLNTFFSSINETTRDDNKLNIDYTDLSYGYTVDTHGDFLIAGAPILSTSPSENQSGRASLHKYNSETQKHDLIKNFYCPFTQNGLAHENRNDNCQFILSEIGDIISNEETTLNDDFGKSVSIHDTICAIGSPMSHINGKNTDQPTGHIFVYEKNKGGKENWGIINVFEGTPDSKFGESVCVDGNYIAVGSPNFDNGNGCVYLFKKTKRTIEHPWIKTSSVYDAYRYDDVLKRYEGFPKSDNEPYLRYLRKRDTIVSLKINKIIDDLKELRDSGVITETEYLENIPTKEDFSEIEPFNYLYNSGEEDCDNLNQPWYKQKVWSKNTHPSVRCKFAETEKYFAKSSWPGYYMDERRDLYIPNPDHEQNLENKWAYRWKIQNVSGGAENIELFSDETDCEREQIGLFSDMSLNSFGDASNFPLVEYSETPDYAIGDTTYDLVGTIKTPNTKIKQFGENVVLKSNKLYVSTFSSDTPRTYMFLKTINEYGCEVWELKNTITDSKLVGHASNKKIDETIVQSIEINHFDSFFEIEICPNRNDYGSWIYSFDTPILNADNEISSGIRVDKCDSSCIDLKTFEYTSSFKKIKNKSASHLPANYGEVTTVDGVKFYSRGPVATRFNEASDDEMKISWLIRENISFAFTNVPKGNFSNKMSIYFDEAKKSDGTFDRNYIIAEIDAHETLDKQTVRIILNSGMGESEYYYEFLYMGSEQGTHYTLGELKNLNDYDCTLRPNQGSSVSISNVKFNDSLKNKSDAIFFSKQENSNSYHQPWSDENTLAISWKNFREDVSFSYPSVSSGKHPCFMAIYADEAKKKNGSYDPIHLLAEIGAQETLNGIQVRLTINTGKKSEYYYDFIYKGSIEGTHYTLSELKNITEYDCTLPPNSGVSVSLNEEDFSDSLENKKYSKFFSKEKNQLSYVEPWMDENTIALSWKNFRENVSFSYPAVKKGSYPSFMTIYANEAKNEDGTYDPLHTLAEIGAQETLNGQKVRLTFNTGFVNGDEYYYEFIYRGSVEGTHYTLNELRAEVLPNYAETKTNSGEIRYIRDYENLNIMKNCRIPKFYSKSNEQLSYVEPFSSDSSIAISWKNFRENVSFSYPNIKAGTLPSFMTIYSNEAKQENGKYDPIYILAEIGASDTLNGELVRLIVNADNCKNDTSYYYEFKYNGSIEGTHFTLNELKKSFDYECTLPANLGEGISLKNIYQNYEDADATFYSKKLGGLSYVHPYTDDDSIALSWKNFRENVSFSYPSVKKGNHPSFMAIYRDGAKQKDGSYDPTFMVAEVGAQETLDGQRVRLTFNTGFKGGDEYYYDFVYRGSIEGTHYTISELKDTLDFDNTLPPNLGGYVSIANEDFVDSLDNKQNAKLYSKSENSISYNEPWSGDNIMSLSWKNFRENVSFSYPSVSAGTKPSFMSIYSNDAIMDDGTYNPMQILAEIGAQETLNGQKVRLTFNTGFVNGNEYFYDFLFDGSTEGTHYTLNELKEIKEYECTLKANQGTYVSLSSIEFEDYLLNSNNAKFFTKDKNQPAFVQNKDKNEISIGWKNFRENVSFSYPSVTSGKEASFMTIYANGAKDKKGNYDPIKILAEICAEDTLNGNVVRLTFNTGSQNDDEFYYEFIYNGSLSGNHYTLNELSENNLLEKIEASKHIERKYSKVIKKHKSSKLRSKKFKKVDKVLAQKITYQTSKSLDKIKSFGLLPSDYGESNTNKIKLEDDILQSDGKITFYKRREGDSLYKEETNLENELEIDWVNVREGVSFYYPTIRKNLEDQTTHIMRIYSNHDTEYEYDKNRLIAEIKSNKSLNGEVVRLSMITNDKTKIFYEFLFDGTELGTDYTLLDLSEKISPRLNKPLIQHSPELENCKVKINKDTISRGLHQLYILFLDNSGQPTLGSESRIEMYNNPFFYDLDDRVNLVKKTYSYSNNIKSEFGKSIDASDNYLVIGNPSDRVYYLDERTACSAGSAFVYKVNESSVEFLEKIYGEDDLENEFSSGFGNSVSILGSSFIVGGHSYEMSNINLNDTNGSKKLEIDDLEFGATKFKDETYNTTEALITDYTIDLDSEIGDAVVKIKIDDLDVNTLLLNEVTLSAGFIDTGKETLRISNLVGEFVEDINGVYRLVKSPINVESGCDIDLDNLNHVYLNNNNWSIYYDKLRGCWLLTDKPNVSVEYQIPETWDDVLNTYEQINNISKFDLFTEEKFKDVVSVYSVIDEELKSEWAELTQKTISTKYVGYVNLIQQLESVSPLSLNKQIIEEIFYLYSANSRKKIDSSILDRWKSSTYNMGMLPFIYELDSVNPISLNFSLLTKTLEIYKLKDYEILKSWSLKLGYKYLLGDFLEMTRPKYHDKLSLQNLKVITKIALDYVNQRKYNNLVISETDTSFNLSEEDIKKYRVKWKPHVDTGFLLSDVFKDLNENVDINFILSNESSSEDLPMEFSKGVGKLSGQHINVFSNNDTTGINNSLTWGVYRDATKIVGNQVHIHVNLLPDAVFDSTVIFVYDSIKSAVNGYVYYYSIDGSSQRSNKLKRMKTNKTKYSCKKQYGYSVSLSKNFICVGSPVLGNFNIDEIVTFGGNSVVSFGTAEKLFIEYNTIHPSYVSQLSKNLVGSIISYDHSAIRDNKKHYIGNIFYKNGVIALTDRSGYFSNVLSNSGVSGFELEFKSMHTLYENEILCRVEPHEFNFSTNPTSVKSGSIDFDINQDGKFDIVDAAYIFKYIMGEVGDIQITDDEIIENETSIKLSDKNKWPKQDVLMTESEDVLLMDLFFSSNIIENRPMHEQIVSNLRTKYEAGEFDINGDGKTDEIDANLLLRYFIGRRGTNLTRNLTNRFKDESRFDSKSIVEYLDEKTGKNLGKEILKDFQDFSENDKKDSTGSYLAPYATTIGLYSGLELAMVAKLGKPVKILPNYPINFLIKFDN